VRRAETGLRHGCGEGKSLLLADLCKGSQQTPADSPMRSVPRFSKILISAISEHGVSPRPSLMKLLEKGFPDARAYRIASNCNRKFDNFDPVICRYDNESVRFLPNSIRI
jgi:hypothetical protein